MFKYLSNGLYLSTHTDMSVYHKVCINSSKEICNVYNHI